MKLIQLNNSKAVIVIDGIIAVIRQEKDLIINYRDGNKVNIPYISEDDLIYNFNISLYDQMNNDLTQLFQLLEDYNKATKNTIDDI